MRRKASSRSSPPRSSPTAIAGACVRPVNPVGAQDSPETARRCPRGTSDHLLLQRNSRYNVTSIRDPDSSAAHRQEPCDETSHETFVVDPEVAERTRLDAIVTVADAVHLDNQLGEHHEAEEQIAFADIVLLNKTDLVDADGLGRVEERIRRINPYARIIRTERCGADLDEVIGLEAFSLERVLAVEPDFLTSDHDHEHDDDVKSLSLVSDLPLDLERFQSWFGQLLQTRGQDILRSKGILDFRGEDDRYVFQGMHMLMDGAPMGAWPAGTRQSRIVFIGRDLDTMDLESGFAACRAA